MAPGQSERGAGSRPPQERAEQRSPLPVTFADTVRGGLSTLLSWLAFGLAAPLWLFHPRVRKGLGVRLGGYPQGLAPGPGPRVWLHGASAGDVLGLVPIIRELRALRPDAKVIVTAMTDSGAAMAAQRLVPQGLADAATFVPWDVPGACNKAVRALRPDVLVLEYTELWPQLIRAASSAGAQLVLTNGRIGPKNVRRYHLLFWLVGNLLQRFELLLMRAEDEAERALLLGARPGSVRVTGNTKFDALAVSVPREPGPDPLLREALGCAGERLWVCGSTHEGEEGPLLEVFKHLKSEFPGLRLVLAPRYVERAPRLVQLARDRGLSVRLRSEPGGAEDVVILDTIGELVRVYTLATVVFVGGSFVKRGGQNVLEPAACGKPVLFGPRMENFVDSVQVLLGRGGLQVKSAGALERLLRDLLSRPGELEKLGEMARAATGAVRGASLRDARLIASLLPPALAAPQRGTP
jgi:3-deoxy-D-manno-octulosonic-acid transferase